MTQTANQFDISEYQVFELAAHYWNRSENIAELFTRYILTGTIPWWVRDFCRKQ